MLRPVKKWQMVLVFIVALGFFWWGYQKWQYIHSISYRLNEIVSSGRKDFQLKEIIGSEWKAVCFLPMSYNYEFSRYSSVPTGEFPQWLGRVLGRTIETDEEYRDMFGEGYGLKFVFDKPRGGWTGVYAVPWQTVFSQEVICTRNPDAVIEIRRDKEGFKGMYWKGYWFKHNFEEVYKLHKEEQLQSLPIPRLIPSTDPKSEGCHDFAWLEVKNREPIKLCGGQDMKKVGEYYFIQKAGGNAAGWGLYRYNPANGKLDVYDFDAREITINTNDKKGAWLEAAYAIHDPKGGYKPDRLERWYWPNDKNVPERQ